MHFFMGQPYDAPPGPVKIVIIFPCGNNISAIHQGKVCAAGVGLTVKRPADSTKAMVLAVFVEFYAVLGLLITIFLVSGIQV